jgi:alkaline phosphatase
MRLQLPGTAVAAFYFLGAAAAVCGKTSGPDIPAFKNIIVMIPDGCGVSHMTISRWFNGAPLHQDSLAVTLVRTWCANSMITGSAAAATAFSTGKKTWEDKEKLKCIGMLPDSQLIPGAAALKKPWALRPVATILEGARLTGKATGIVVTSKVTHATPAGFAGHWHDRDYNNIFMEQMAYGGIDVVMGGGMEHLVDTLTPVPGFAGNGKRKDGDNLYEYLRAKGFLIINTRDELLGLKNNSRKVWGLFSASHMAYSMERKRFAPSEPTLAEMTRTALKILSQNPHGFFLMVEGSHVDWVSHDNDPAGVVTEYCAFDMAVGEALRFAKSDKGDSTLVLVVPDHDNGGMTLKGRYQKYERFVPDECVAVLKRPKITAASTEILVRKSVDRHKPDPEIIRKIVAAEYGIDDLTEKETAELIAEFADTLEKNHDGSIKLGSDGKPVVAMYRSALRVVMGSFLSGRAGIGWATQEHDGSDVPLFTYGLKPPPPSIDNTKIAQICARAFGFDLDSVTSRLMCEATERFKGRKIAVDSAGVEYSKGSLVVDSGGTKTVFPFFKNIAVRDGDTLALEGITLYSQKTNRVYLPRMAAKIVEGKK